jgi:hypothetical protein
MPGILFQAGRRTALCVDGSGWIRARMPKNQPEPFAGEADR